MNIVAIIGIGVVGAVLSQLIKQYKPEYGLFVSLGTGILIVGLVVIYVSPILTGLQEFVDRSGMDRQYGAILIKSLGICYITQVACESCSDAGETAIASKIELAGKISVVLLALPLFEAIAKIAFQLIEG